MSENNLIENAKALLADGDGYSGAGALAMALENLVEYAETMKREMHSRELHHFEEEQLRAQAEAVIEEALGHNPWHVADEGHPCGGMSPCIRRILNTYQEGKNDASQ